MGVKVMNSCDTNSFTAANTRIIRVSIWHPSRIPHVGSHLAKASFTPRHTFFFLEGASICGRVPSRRSYCPRCVVARNNDDRDPRKPASRGLRVCPVLADRGRRSSSRCRLHVALLALCAPPRRLLEPRAHGGAGGPRLARISGKLGLPAKRGEPAVVPRPSVHAAVLLPAVDALPASA